MTGVRLSILLAAALACLPAEAREVFRWRDAGGHWHFADAPPEGVSAERLVLDGGPGPGPATTASEHHARWAAVLADPAGEAESRRRLKAKAAARRAETRERAARTKRCERYAAALERLDSRLRAGYSAGQGMRLGERRRELREAQWAECR